MTTLEPVAGSLPGRSAARILVLTVALAAAVTLLPALAAALVPARSTVVGPATEVVVPLPRTPAFRVTAPAGWAETTVPTSADRALTWSRGPDTIEVYASPRVRDVDSYAARMARLATADEDLTVVSAGPATGPDGLTGTRMRVSDPDGKVGELVVLGRDHSGVALLSRSGPDRPVDLRPLVDSLWVAS